MLNESLPSQPVLILGAGRGGSAFLDLLSDEKLFHVVGIADADAKAPAFKQAKRMGIKAFLDVEEALNTCKPCTVFNLTHDETLAELASAILGPSNVIGGLQAKLIWKMVVQLKSARDELKQSQVFTQSIISNAMEGIILINARGVIQSFNPAAEFMFGYSQDEVVGKNISMLMPEPDSHSHDQYLKRYIEKREAHVVGIEREVTAQRKGGRTFPMSLAVNEMASGEELFFIGLVRDITQRKKSEEEIKRLAHFDTTTNLPNRVLYFDRLKHSLAQAKRKKRMLAVLFLDLDGFKYVNDTLGHEAGDRVLKDVAKRLTSVMREVDTVARFGGDEFAFVIDDIRGTKDVEVVATKVLGTLSQPFTINDNKCDVGGSIGISLFPDHSATVAGLIRQADHAMYEVKKGGKNGFCYYEQHMEKAMSLSNTSYSD